MCLCVSLCVVVCRCVSLCVSVVFDGALQCSPLVGSLEVFDHLVVTYLVLSKQGLGPQTLSMRSIDKKWFCMCL